MKHRFLSLTLLVGLTFFVTCCAPQTGFTSSPPSPTPISDQVNSQHEDFTQPQPLFPAGGSQNLPDDSQTDGSGLPLKTWETIIDTAVIENIQWEQYTSPISAPGKGQTVKISIDMPSGWLPAETGNPDMVSLSSFGSLPGQANPDFLKIDIVFMRRVQDFTLSPASFLLEIGNTQAEASIIANQEGQMEVISAVLPHNDASYLITAYLNLTDKNPERLRAYESIIYHIFSTITIN